MKDALDSAELNSLLSSSADGNQQSFETLYRATSPYLNALVMRVVGQKNVAQEVLQEAYVQIWQQAARFDASRGTPMAWLTNIARSRALDRIRHEKSQSQRIENVSAEPMISAVEDSSQHMRFSSELKRLAHCLQPLSQQQRKSIILAFCYGLSHSELSERIEVPIGTVKSWIRRGMSSVKRCLQS